MEIKYCSGCDIEKCITEFHTRTRKSGHIYVFKYCKECEKVRKKQPKYKKKVSENRKKKYNEDEEYRKSMIDKASNYYQENTDRVKEYQREYHKREDVVNRRHQRRYDRRQTDKEYRIMCNLSGRIQRVLKSYKSMRTNQLIGCTPKFFKDWLEHQFDSKMSWDNYGTYWHIDHVTPCNSFDLTNLDEQKICFHWTNCQPLEKIENIKKNDNIIPFQILMQEIKVKYYKKSISQHTL